MLGLQKRILGVKMGVNEQWLKKSVPNGLDKPKRQKHIEHMFSRIFEECKETSYINNLYSFFMQNDYLTAKQLLMLEKIYEQIETEDYGMDADALFDDYP